MVTHQKDVLKQIIYNHEVIELIKNKFKFNIIDIILILLGLYIVSFFVFYYFNDNATVDITRKEPVEVVISFNTENHDEFPLNVGDFIGIGSIDNEFGTVKNIQYISDLSLDTDSRIFNTNAIIECKALYSDGEYKIGNYNFKIGDVLELCIDDYYFYPTVQTVRHQIAFANEFDENEVPA